MGTSPTSSSEEKMKLVLIGVAVGAGWGVLYHVLLLWERSVANSYVDMRAFTVIFAVATVGMCLACFWLGRWCTPLDGGVHWLTCATALVAAADVLWYSGHLRFGTMPLPETWCLTIALATFIFATGFLASPKDKIVR